MCLIELKQESGFCMTKLECGTPRAIVSRWLASLKSGYERNDDEDRRRRNGKRKVRYDDGGENLQVNCSTKCLNEESVTNPNKSCECGHPVVKGFMKSKNEDTFNLGAGFGLAFLIASSKTELNKMIQLREQMECIIQRSKDDLQSVDKVSKSSVVRRTVDYSTTDVEESMNSNGGYFSHTDYTPSEQRVPLKFQNPNLRKDMEIELESELKHLQLLCESEDPYQFSGHVNNGVPPEELALRLHEIVESRQEERIKELEDALTEAIRKLDEKQSEVLWWKETAQLFSQRLPEVPNTSSSSLRSKYVVPAAPQRSKRSVRLAEKLSNEILMNP